MRTLKETLNRYYEGWKGAMDWSLFSPEIHFQGPLMQCQGIAAFQRMIQDMSEEMTVTKFEVYMQFIKVGEKGEDGQACTLLSFDTSGPFKTSTKCAEFYLFDNQNRIKAIEIIYDAREWAKHLEAMPTM